MRRMHVYSIQTQAAAKLLGLEIARARRERRLTVAELAERTGTSPVTVRKIERGDPAVTMGTAFELAWLVGVPLFGADEADLSSLVERARDRLALLPGRVREPVRDVHDDF